MFPPDGMFPPLLLVLNYNYNNNNNNYYYYYYYYYYQALAGGEGNMLSPKANEHLVLVMIAIF